MKFNKLRRVIVNVNPRYLLIAIFSVIALSVVPAAQVKAETKHSIEGHYDAAQPEDCLDICGVARGIENVGTTKNVKKFILDEDESKPDPEPTDRDFYIYYQCQPSNKNLKPSKIYSSNRIRPPDIVRQDVAYLD